MAFLLRLVKMVSNGVDGDVKRRVVKGGFLASRDEIVRVVGGTCRHLQYNQKTLFWRRDVKKDDDGFGDDNDDKFKYLNLDKFKYLNLDSVYPRQNT